MTTESVSCQSWVRRLGCIFTQAFYQVTVPGLCVGAGGMQVWVRRFTGSKWGTWIPVAPERVLPVWGGRGLSVQPCLLELREQVSENGIIGHHSSGVCGHLEICWSDHHGRGLERVAWAFPVVPLNTVELVCVLLLWVVHSVQVGGTARIKPPACESKTQKELGTR